MIYALKVGKHLILFVCIALVCLTLVMLIRPSQITSPTHSLPVITKTPPGVSPTTMTQKHIFLIMMENKGYDNIIGNTQAPYINTLAHTYALATNYSGVSHPSLPNYLALTAGSTLGITSDCNSCYQNSSNIGDEIERAGETWKAYMQDMPSPCYIGNTTTYAQKHDPFIYYDDIRTNAGRCQSHIVPLSQLTTDIKGNSVPDFTWITPNLCNDMHDCSVAAGDTWFSQFLPTILDSDAYKNDGTIYIVWDESDSIIDPHIPMIIISNNIHQAVYTDKANHYTLLAAIEDQLHLPRLGQSIGISSNL